MSRSGASDDPHTNDPVALGESTGASSASRPRLGLVGRLLWLGVAALPRNALSRLAGRLASLRLPAALQRAEIRLFARWTGADLAEAAQPVEAYPTLNAFFTRSLRPGARPVASEADAVVSPCDGSWGAAGRVERGTILQVKGSRYRVADLLGDASLARAYEEGCYATLYLSPRDYHRFHTPVAGTIRRVDYWPGSLWPVNALGLLGVDGLFARNERICAYLEPDSGAGVRAEMATGASAAAAPAIGSDATPIALVAVGATMVGSVRLTFSDLQTNRRAARPERRDLGSGAPRFERGEEWGRFEFGSTIVMLTPRGRYLLDAPSAGTPVRLGERIGRRLA